MNKLIFRGALRLGLLVLFLELLTARAQMPGGDNSAMIKLFGDNAAFTARAEVQVAGTNRIIWFRMPSTFTEADNKLRVEVDLGQIQSRAVGPAVIAHYKQLGIDRVTSVVRPDKRVTYIIYPNARSYATMPLAVEDAQIASQKLEKKPLGRETVDGHACVKNYSTVKSPKGAVLLQAVTWNAADLKDFPVQIQTQENGNTTLMHFQQISLAKPAATLFEPPAGYKQFSNPQDLQDAAEKQADGRKKK
ncbi:MAG TPA: hypothetical protein VG938_03650 [Verrucomicrobiae bacterium]|jgi:hypothetical protein|nr:hypothetical protein [Verrucomicrobiae bacterium]